jgi:hypothetical protein
MTDYEVSSTVTVALGTLGKCLFSIQNYRVKATFYRMSLMDVIGELCEPPFCGARMDLLLESGEIDYSPKKSGCVLWLLEYHCRTARSV